MRLSVLFSDYLICAHGQVEIITRFKGPALALPKLVKDFDSKSEYQENERPYVTILMSQKPLGFVILKQCDFKCIF